MFVENLKVNMPNEEQLTQRTDKGRTEISGEKNPELNLLLGSQVRTLEVSILVRFSFT